MGFPTDLIRFRACAWPVASGTDDEVEAARREALAHREGSAVVVSCQRIEAYHFDDCDCSADVHWTGFDALARMAEVAAGLHSVVLGEEQILGQVRDGLERSAPEVAQPGALAIAAARQLRQETEFGTHTGHLLDRALQVAELDPAGLHIAILGAGSAARLVAERSAVLGFAKVTIASRRHPEATWFPALDANYHPLDSLATLASIDVLVCCLGSGAPSLRAEGIPAVRFLVVDLATPRKLPLDLPVPALTIRSLVEDEGRRRHSVERRAVLRSRLHAILERRLRMSAEDSQSAVGRLRFEVERVRREEVARTVRLHPDLSPDAIDTITRALMNRLFHQPTQRLRELGDAELGSALADLFASETRKGASR